MKTAALFPNFPFLKSTISLLVLLPEVIVAAPLNQMFQLSSVHRLITTCEFANKSSVVSKFIDGIEVMLSQSHVCKESRGLSTQPCDAPVLMVRGGGDIVTDPHGLRSANGGSQGPSFHE